MPKCLLLTSFFHGFNEPRASLSGGGLNKPFSQIGKLACQVPIFRLVPLSLTCVSSLHDTNTNTNTNANTNTNTDTNINTNANTNTNTNTNTDTNTDTNTKKSVHGHC